MKKTMQFIIVTCGLSWIIAGAAILLGLHNTRGLPYLVFASFYMLLPALCSILLQIVHKEKPFRNLNISFKFNRWFVIAGIVPVLYSFMTLGINMLFPSVSFSVSAEGFLSGLPAEQAETAARQLSRFPPAVFLLIQLFNAIIAGYTVNALFAFGEELGWRAYLLKSLRGKKFLPASLVIGVVWGLWHFPLILLGHNYPEHPAAGTGLMVIFCALLTPVMVYIVIKSKSVITAAVFHGVNNAIGGISILYLTGGNDITNGITGIAGFIALLVTNLAFFLFDRYVTKEGLFTKTIGEYGAA